MPRPIVTFDHVSFTYRPDEQDSAYAVRDLSLTIPEGGHVALLGANGSGKSTIARLMNGLLLPDTGDVIVAGLSTADDEALYEIRRRVGMVFQNPDNQIIEATVADDIAFGPSNLGLPYDDIMARVEEALNVTGLKAMATRAPHELSGGQKQKLAIGSILAMHPDCVVLDEATAMLDPVSRRDLLALVLAMHREQGMAIVQITHDMNEAMLADYVYVIDRGKIALEGKPGEIFLQIDAMKHLGLDVPPFIEIAHRIGQYAGRVPGVAEAEDEAIAVRFVNQCLDHIPTSVTSESKAVLREKKIGKGDPLIRVKDLSHTYGEAYGKPHAALRCVSFEVYRGEIVGLVGATGSGKSTLIQHLNGLIRPDEGAVRVLGSDLSDKKEIRRIRRHVGLLFQYPEDQLFEETVALDIAFGPKEMSFEPADVARLTERAARATGISHLMDRSPFELSGGQQRRVAIAGILAVDPDIIILDEPCAGLDPIGRERILEDMAALCHEGKTLIMVSHDMETVARYADRILVLKEGRAVTMTTPSELFASDRTAREAGLQIPSTVRFLEKIKPYRPDLETAQFDIRSAVDALLKVAGVRRS